MKLRFRPLSSDKEEPTVRQRALRLFPELNRRGIDAAIWDGHENCDMIVLQYTPSDAMQVSKYCDYVVADINDAVFMKTHPGFPSFEAGVDYIDYWATGSNRIAAHLSERFGKHVVSYVEECIDPLYDGVKCSTSKKINIMSMGLADNIIFIPPIIEVLNTLSNEFDITLRLVYPRFTSKGKLVSDVTELANFQCEWVEWSHKSVQDTVKKSNIAITPTYYNEWCKCKSPNRAVALGSCGLCVIAQSIDSYEEIIRDGENGFLANSAQEWYDSFRFVFENMNRVNGIGKKLADEVKEAFSINTVCDRWESIIKKVVL